MADRGIYPDSCLQVVCLGIVAVAHIYACVGAGVKPAKSGKASEVTRSTLGDGPLRNRSEITLKSQNHLLRNRSEIALKSL